MEMLLPVVSYPCFTFYGVTANLVTNNFLFESVTGR